MKLARITLCLLTSTISAPAEDRPDLLRFTNHDQLRGSFTGMREGPELLWKNDDLTETTAFKTSRIRHISLRGGHPKQLIDTLAHIVLTNEDKIPGLVTAVDADTVTLDTTHAGRLFIPREHVAKIVPNPLGGKTAYHGPFSSDGWTMRHDQEKAGKTAGEDNAPERLWEFTGSAWYWRHKEESIALVRESGMPEQSVLRFELAWKNRLGLFIALHADFAVPKPKQENDKQGGDRFPAGFRDPATLPGIFGNCFLIQIQNNYLSLLKSTVGADGVALVDRPHHSGGMLKLENSGQARFEIRSNRRTGEISIFVNDEFVTQWSDDLPRDDAEPDAINTPKSRNGSGLGFCAFGRESMYRISDISLTEWNGMPDSARSMQMEDSDVALMCNGTDRFSGRLDTLDAEGNVWFEGRHGRFRFPLADLAEVRFATSKLTRHDAPSTNQIHILFAPVGRISGQPISSNGSQIEIISPLVGKMNISLESAVMIDFNPSTSAIDDWNENF